ncbi:hypothetical protein KUTeg_001272 [Tegillarca granosa]|uniref:Uncharacterized protein n=1 Tax=Tegillarca granosa TaxID=220873 RepID=A0ABQ9FYQ2_TEGGR|nr:hypothetical protein KUTeg_001272 [Tegillarca granosa]
MLLGYYTENMQDDKYQELKKLRVAYKYRSNVMYAGARYQCTHHSLAKARRPSNLLSKMELMNLKCFIRSEIADTVENFTRNSYSWLRTLFVGCLTLYNARRGEEPSRMLLNGKDALADTWLPSESIEAIEDQHVDPTDSFTTTYPGSEAENTKWKYFLTFESYVSCAGTNFHVFLQNGTKICFYLDESKKACTEIATKIWSRIYLLLQDENRERERERKIVCMYECVGVVVVKGMREVPLIVKLSFSHELVTLTIN